MMLKAMISIENADYFGALTHDQKIEEPCHIYTNDQTFSYNFYTWTVGLFLGLQWTHVEPLLGPLVAHFVLVWSVMIHWPWYTWLIFILAMTFIAVTLTYSLYLYASIGLFDTYVQAFFLVIAIFGAISAYYKGKRYLHIHHYVIGYFVMAFVCW